MAEDSYGNGAWLQPGWTSATNTSSSPEPVLTAEQWCGLAEED